MKLLNTIPIVFFSVSSVGLAATVRLDDVGSPGLGDNLDGISVVPTTIAVPEIAGLQMTIHAISGSGAGSSLNTTATSFGINSGDLGDDTDAFDSTYGESVTFSFNLDVSVSQLDFTTFSSGEVFQFGATFIVNGDLSNGTTDVFNFSVPLVLAKNEQVTISATTGTIGIEAMNVSAVPEPSAVSLLGFAGLAALFRRKR